METTTKKRPTVADVAHAAGVSLMTVSRVMNDKPGVGDELRQRIQALADEMGYRPSRVARGLATRQSATIGFVVPDITNHFFAHIARGAEDVAYEKGYSLLLINTSEDMDREVAALESLWQSDSDGVILCSSRLPIDELESGINRMPAVVLINRVFSSLPTNVATINVDDNLGAQLAVRRFLESGRKRIAMLAGPPYSVSAQRRLDGYRAALEAGDHVFDPAMIQYCEPDYAGGQAAMSTILARRPKIDALLAFNDLVAVGAIQKCQELGKVVPDDVAVIGFDDIPLASIVRPRLTTVHVNLAHIGRMAMQTVLDLINSHESAVGATLSITPEIILRESA